jgi:hypothetical protein
MVEKMTTGHGIAENAYVRIWKEDGILVVVYKKNTVIGLEVAKEITTFCKNYSGDVSYPVLSYIQYIKVISKEAREYFACKEACEKIIKGAVIVDSGFSRILGNIFLTIDKPAVPSKMFTNKEEAIKWLKKE